MQEANGPSRALRGMVLLIAGGILLNSITNLIEGADRILLGDSIGAAYLVVGVVGLTVAYHLSGELQSGVTGTVLPVAAVVYLAVTLAETAVTSPTFTTRGEYAGVLLVWVLLSVVLLRYRSHTARRQPARAS